MSACRYSFNLQLIINTVIQDKCNHEMFVRCVPTNLADGICCTDKFIVIFINQRLHVAI